MRACLRRISSGANDCVIPLIRLDIVMGTFVGFSLPRRLRGVNTVAKGDKEDYNGGETGESLFLLADRSSPSQGKVGRGDIQS